MISQGTQSFITLNSVLEEMSKVTTEQVFGSPQSRRGRSQARLIRIYEIISSPVKISLESRYVYPLNHLMERHRYGLCVWNEAFLRK